MAVSTSWPSASRMSPKTTLAPSRAKVSASAAPCPRAPPLISATFPSSLPMVFFLSLSRWLPLAAGPIGRELPLAREVDGLAEDPCQLLGCVESHRVLGRHEV